MRNLAGVPVAEANAAVLAEIAGAGLEPAPISPIGEVSATVGARLVAGLYTFQFHRAWVYWVARCEPELPQEIARDLNDAPHSGGGTHYSGSVAFLGAVARARGFAGGLPSSEIKTTDCWHIDTPGGLRAFTDWIKGRFS